MLFLCRCHLQIPYAQSTFFSIYVRFCKEYRKTNFFDLLQSFSISYFIPESIFKMSSTVTYIILFIYYFHTSIIFYFQLNFLYSSCRSCVKFYGISLLVTLLISTSMSKQYANVAILATFSSPQEIIGFTLENGV